jgi:hypothetical protein
MLRASSVTFCADVRHEPHEGPRENPGNPVMLGPVVGLVKGLAVGERENGDAVLKSQQAIKKYWVLWGWRWDYRREAPAQEIVYKHE